MPDLNDYRCPPDCPKRSKTCHAECERHDIFRKLNEERKEKLRQDSLTVTEAMSDKLNFSNKRFYKI